MKSTLSTRHFFRKLAAMTAIATALPLHAQAQGANPADMVDALNGVFGRHAGARASHAKGQCVVGQFEPSAALRRVTRSALFAPTSLDVLARVSIGGGNPGVSDKSRTVRGLAVRMGSGSSTFDLVMISEPAFFAATPESFVSFLQARVPDPATKKPDPAKIAAHNARFPDGKVQPALLAAHPAPASYATTPYFSNHALRFVDASGRGTWARINFEPVAGTVYLDADTEARGPDSFLVEELSGRLARGPVEFKLVAQLPTAADSLTDSTQQWAGAERLALGTLRIKAFANTPDCDAITFVPTLLPDGIEPSDDPILKARAAAYGVSLARRRTP